MKSWIDLMDTILLFNLLPKVDHLSLWVVLAFSMLTSGVLYHCCSVFLRNWRMKRRFRHGAQAEREAVKFLQRQGYRILAAQLEESIVVYVDGTPQRSSVRADFLVRKGWKRYIVEVKSGQQGTMRLPNVRRQLLEYKLVYRPDGVLLLDMEHRRLQEVRFAYIEYQRRNWLRYGVVSLLTGLVVCIVLQIV